MTSTNHLPATLLTLVARWYVLPVKMWSVRMNEYIWTSPRTIKKETIILSSGKGSILAPWSQFSYGYCPPTIDNIRINCLSNTRNKDTTITNNNGNKNSLVSNAKPLNIGLRLPKPFWPFTATVTIWRQLLPAAKTNRNLCTFPIMGTFDIHACHMVQKSLHVLTMKRYDE